MTNIFALASLLAAIPCASAQAQEHYFPALYDVVEMSAGEDLTVHAMPDTDSEVVATLAADRRAVEVLRLSRDSRWARVGLGERSGWIPTRALERRPAQDAARLPAPMRCWGTEPFWSLYHPQDEIVEFEQMPDPVERFTIVYQAVPERRAPRDILARLTAEGGGATLFVRRESCADGMSDREFGLSIRLLLEDGGPPRALVGCCALSGG